MIRVGFTGTREGMTVSQYKVVDALLEILASMGPIAAHHGDCIGADSHFHAAARKHGAFLVGHPPVRRDFRAWCAFDEVRPSYPYLVRNQHIVNDATIMIATPFEATRQTKGGTWYTIDRALESGKPLALLLPRDGGTTVQYYGASWPVPRAA